LAGTKHMSSTYYDPPTDEVFAKIKKAAISIWKSYDDTNGYASGKIDKIKNLDNIQDNAMYIVSMFDFDNQAKLFDIVGQDITAWILEKLKQ